MNELKNYSFDLSGTWTLRFSVLAENDEEAEMLKEEALDEIRDLVTSLDVDFESICCSDN